MASLMVRLGHEVDGMAQGKASSHCLGCVLITGVGLLINSAFERYSSPRCLRLHSGSALYTYWIGCTVQLALLHDHPAAHCCAPAPPPQLQPHLDSVGSSSVTAVPSLSPALPVRPTRWMCVSMSRAAS